jgi:hypothetical protein
MRMFPLQYQQKLFLEYFSHYFLDSSYKSSETKNIKGYLLLICVLCIVGLPERKLVRVWEDDFNSNGTVDHNKWDFDVGGHGWGM